MRSAVVLFPILLLASAPAWADDAYTLGKIDEALVTLGTEPTHEEATSALQALRRHRVCGSADDSGCLPTDGTVVRERGDLVLARLAGALAADVPPKIRGEAAETLSRWIPGVDDTSAAVVFGALDALYGDPIDALQPEETLAAMRHATPAEASLRSRLEREGLSSEQTDVAVAWNAGAAVPEAIAAGRSLDGWVARASEDNAPSAIAWLDLSGAEPRFRPAKEVAGALTRLSKGEFDGEAPPVGLFLSPALLSQARDTLWQLRVDAARTLFELPPLTGPARDPLFALVDRVGAGAGSAAKPEAIEDARAWIWVSTWRQDRGRYFDLLGKMDPSELGMKAGVQLTLELLARMGRHAYLEAPDELKALPPTNQYASEPSIGWFMIGPFTEVPEAARLSDGEVAAIARVYCALPSAYVQDPAPGAVVRNLPQIPEVLGLSGCHAAGGSGDALQDLLEMKGR